MSELAILSERAPMVFEEMFAELSFILLLQSIELSLISVEVIVV
jgi:hypothetical protein